MRHSGLYKYHLYVELNVIRCVKTDWSPLACEYEGLASIYHEKLALISGYKETTSGLMFTHVINHRYSPCQNTLFLVFILYNMK